MSCTDGFIDADPHPLCAYGGGVRQEIDAAWGDLPAQTGRRLPFANAAELYGVEAPDRPWQGGSSG